MYPLMEIPVLKAVLMGIVEGATEFLPVSSTGHLILAGHVLGLSGGAVKVFEIAIQSGAMIAVLWHYRARFYRDVRGIVSDAAAQRFWMNIAVAFAPSALAGLAFGSWIVAHLFTPVTVAVAFIAGGVAILWAERRRHRVRVANVEEMTWRDALKIGIAQCLALIPGTSRSAATIIGGLLFGCSRKVATEFSFFLAVPTLFAAGVYQIARESTLLSVADIASFAAGAATAFVSALASVRWLLRYVSSHDFTLFAWYRIAFGILVLATAEADVVDWSP